MARMQSNTVYILLLMYCFIRCNAYRSLLASSLTDPVRERQVTDTKEVITKYRPVLLKDFSWDVTQLEYCESYEDCLIKVINSKNGLLYTVVPDVFYDMTIWDISDPAKGEPLLRIDTSITSVLDSILLRPGSPLTGPLNQHIKRSVISGLLVKYMDHIKFSQKIKAHKRFPQIPLVVPLDYLEFREIYVALIIGYVLSIVTFVTEILYDKYKRQA